MKRPEQVLSHRAVTASFEEESFHQLLKKRLYREAGREMMIQFTLLLAAGLAAAGPASADDWAAMDTNGDGQLSQTEFSAALQAKWKRMDANEDGKLSPGEAGLAKGAAWTRADADGNGYLSQAEFSAHKQEWFTRADKNADGVLTKVEYDTARTAP